MEEDILREMLAELKGLRQGQSETNARLDQTNQRLESLEQTTNVRFESLERTTNKRFESLERTMNERFESLERTTNERFGSLERTTNERFESLERTTNEHFASMDKRFEGLAASVQVLTQGFNEVRYELVEIKKLLATRVIWNNDSIILQVRDGKPLYGTIRKDEKKGE